MTVLSPGNAHARAEGRTAPRCPRTTAAARSSPLARELDLEVVAEGIETAAQLDYLSEAGATHGQGFHLARPMPAAELTKLLQA